MNFQEGQTNFYDNYKKEIEKYIYLWNSFEVRTIIGKKNEKWSILAMRVFFHVKKYSQDFHDILLETPHIIMIKEIKNISNFNAFLSSLSSNSFSILSKPLDVKNFNFYLRRGRKTDNPPDIYIEWPKIWLIANGTAVRDLIDENVIDVELNRSGYGNLNEESAELLEISTGMGYLANITLVAPIFLKVNSSVFMGDKLEVTVKCSEHVSHKDLKLMSPIKRGIPIEFNHEKNKDDFKFISYGIESISDELEEIKISLFFKDEPELIDKEICRKLMIEAYIGNPQIGVLKLFLEEKLFREWLGLEGRINFEKKGKGQNLDQFEISCMNMFSCAGFHLLNFGNKWDIQGIDFPLFSPDSKDMLIVSCVRSSAIREKIENIKPACNILKERFQNYNIWPIICTPAPEEDIINDSKEICFNEKIALITPSELSIIFDFAMKGEHKKILSFIVNIIKQIRPR